MPRAAALPLDDRWLDAAECAERAHVDKSRWWGIAERSLILRHGKRARGRRTFWLLSKVVEFLHFPDVDFDDAEKADAVRSA